MEIYNTISLQDSIEKALKEFESKDIYLAVFKCSKGVVHHSGHISLYDIIVSTTFFTTCVIKDYQELLKKVYDYRWSLDVSRIQLISNKYYITIKVLLD